MLDSCFIGLASTAQNVVGSGELVDRVAHHLGAELDARGRITTHIEETAALLAETRCAPDPPARLR